MAMICAACFRDRKPLRRGLCGACWAHRRLYDGWESKYVDAQPTRAHINMLIVAGLGTRQIEALSGVSRKTIRQVLSGRSDRGTGPSKKVLTSTAERIQAVPIPKDRHELAADSQPVLAVGTTRRLQALVAIGYTQSYLAGRMGMEPTNATELLYGKRNCVSARRARVVADLYNELSTMPPTDNRPMRGAPLGWPQRSRERARQLGWADPFAWEDEDLDDPDARPAPLPPERTLTRRERYYELVNLGLTKYEIAGKLGIEYESLLKWIAANEHAETMALFEVLARALMVARLGEPDFDSDQAQSA